MKRLLSNNVVKRAIRWLVLLVIDKPLGPSTNRDDELVEELRSIFRQLPCSYPSGGTPSEVAWINNMKRLRELVFSDNPRKFLRWDVISETMFVSNPRYISRELHFLKGLPDWKDRWREAIMESPVGHPIPYWKYPCTSGNMIHHAYHIAQFEQKTGMYINSMDLILEFGGGYGGMCRLLRNLGFEGQHIIFDLPPFSALQKFFLNSVGIRVGSADSFKISTDGVICISDLEQLKAILSNCNGRRDSMFIATWSISEVPVNVRKSVLPLTYQFKGFLIAYQEKFGEVNNIEFFSDWKTVQGDVEWYNWEIEHLKHNAYLVGKRTAEK